MKFNIDETVFYDGEFMKVWDYSPRSKSYQLKSLDTSEELIHAPEEKVEESTLQGYEKYAVDLHHKITAAEQDIRIPGYRFLRDLGKKVYEAYEYELLTSQKFLEVFIHIIEQESKKED